MESNYPDTDNEPGHDYFSYRQYINRLFYEHNWRPQVPSDAACTSDIESEPSYRSAVNKSKFTKPPKKAPLHAIRRNRSETQRNRSVPTRKVREVRQFRKWLLPKTAYATLKDLSAPLQTEVTIYPSNQGVKAEILVNNVTYAAVDQDKNAAKDKASEQALRDLIAPSGDLPMECLAPFAIHKLMTEWKAPALDTDGKESPVMKLSSPEIPAPADPADQQATSSREIQVVQPFPTDVREFAEQRTERTLSAEQPAGGSGILTEAIHKLLIEWKARALDTNGKGTPELAPDDQRATISRGIQVVQPFLTGRKEFDEQSLPEMSASVEQPAGGSRIWTVAVNRSRKCTVMNRPKVVKTAADLPRNASTHHPGCLFAYMRPQCKYNEFALNSNDRKNTGEKMFAAGLYTDGRYFEGKGRSKKLARMAAAVEACKVLFGVVFDERTEKITTGVTKEEHF